MGGRILGQPVSRAYGNVTTDSSMGNLPIEVSKLTFPKARKTLHDITYPRLQKTKQSLSQQRQLVVIAPCDWPFVHDCLE